ncbi:MAG: serine protease [Planctomycetales bacterium]|nr:serine protease [Planctomycetales bacterium]
MRQERRIPRLFSRWALCMFLAALSLAVVRPDRVAAQTSFAGVVDAVQPKIVKIYGAGGFAGLEAYQSGFLISAEGHVLTVWSYVLDTEFITVSLDDGRKFQAELVGTDPRLEIAVLKVPAEQVAFFNLHDAVELEAGDRVLTFSNLFGVATGNEPVSVLHGSVAVKTDLAARRGAFATNYKGPVYVVDAITNNPGAAGGAATDGQGRLVGMLGKELKNSLNDTWLNYAVPIGELVGSVDDIIAGRFRPRSEDDSLKKPTDAHSLATLGIVLLPNVLSKTPPFVDSVLPTSSAEKAGLRPDDLILFVNDRVATSSDTLRDELSYIDRLDPVRLIVERDKELLEVELLP